MTEAERIRNTGWTCLGLLAGGFCGFLLRPAIPLVGVKLPFEVVMTRGSFLQGLDQMLVPLAQSSFDHVLAGAVSGAILGLVIGLSRTRQPG